MSGTTENHAERINLRLKSSAKRTLERAASLEGRTLSSYVLSHALSSAEASIREYETLKLRAEEAEAFLEALERPPRLNGRMVAALEEHGRRVEQE